MNPSILIYCSFFRRVSVRLGEWDSDNNEDCQNYLCADPVVDIRVKRVILHELYSNDGTDPDFDIALIELEQDASFSDWIQPICLPVQHHLKYLNYNRVPLTVDGWGSTSSFDCKCLDGSSFFSFTFEMMV